MEQASSQFAVCLRKYGVDESSIHILDSGFNLEKKKGQFPFGHHTSTYEVLQSACEETARDGYHCYDDMFIWAGSLMDKVPGIVEVIRARFPILFVDEAQDNREDQSAILHRIFRAGNGPVVRQRFGDNNQAIFDSTNASEATGTYSRTSQSRRICQTAIASVRRSRALLIRSASFPTV